MYLLSEKLVLEPDPSMMRRVRRAVSGEQNASRRHEPRHFKRDNLSLDA
jgi:hypothetical protein